MPSKEFTYTGQWQRWAVPDKVEWVEVTIDGAGSGETPGGRVTGRVNVKRHSSLHLLVGQKGKLAGEGTFGGGGAAGEGTGNPSGFSGGGASFIRVESRTGTLRAVAGGAGGASGDGGQGGRGGGDVAAAGFPSSAVTAAVGNASGGTQIQGGNGGQAVAAADLAGGSAADTVLARAGAGGGPARARVIGGGGGGGGYHGGGGGQAGLVGESPGGGGGGGSSFIGGLTSYTNQAGGGGLGHGQITLSWVAPPPRNQPPSAPTEVKVGGKDYAEDMATLSKGRVAIKAKVNDPSKSGKVRLLVYYSPDASFRNQRLIKSEPVERGKVAKVQLAGLTRNTQWHLRLYTQDGGGLRSVNYTAVRFWTNRPPNPPEPLSPGDNSTIPDLNSILFTWNHSDPDHPENAPQRGFGLQWRRAGSPLWPAGAWKSVTFRSADETYVGEPADFKQSTVYEWRVRTQDEQEMWGNFSVVRSFFVAGVSAPPRPTFPIRGEAVTVDDALSLQWAFRSPTVATQYTADVRYRGVGATDWITLFGNATSPGVQMEAGLPDSLPPGHWEWEVRTYSDGGANPSDWSDTEDFWVVGVPAAVDVDPNLTYVSESRLGCGPNKVYVYRRGGKVRVGEITPMRDLSYTRKRDDIGDFKGNTNEFGPDCGAMLKEVHCWTHEIVVYRDGERTFEGPITRITDTPNGLHIEAGDVMRYVYRRIMRHGYNDAYRVLNNVQLGQLSVVQRARQIILNALAPDDPNVLEHLTTFDFHDDARQSRSVPDFAKMAWEEVDSLAATGGLDYTTIGRRIMLWDTHRPIGRLPELRTKHFSEPPVVSEYGMLLATDFGVTNNNGTYGLATRRAPGEVPPYGLVEQLASAYGEEEGTAPAANMTSEAQADLELTLALQAERNIANRYPTPLVVRVPDNSTLMPDTPVRLAHLVPGVWIPLRADGTLRKIAQWQKLDVVTVSENEKGETIQVTMSPAPNAGADPDADAEEVLE